MPRTPPPNLAASSFWKLAPVIINDKVHLTANKTAVDANERCRGVPVDVGQRFLSDAEQRALNFDSETIEL